MIIGFCNEKGGVGKTTLAIHTATWLVRQGRQVVLMDLDTQAGISNFFGVQPADDVAELLRSVLYLRRDRRPSISSFLHTCPGYSDLALLRGHSVTGDVEAALREPGTIRPGAVLAEALGPLTSKGVTVVIDSGPHRDKLQEAVLQAADHVFVPGIPEGATEDPILNVVQHLHELGRVITGLIPTMVVTNSKKHRETVQDWKSIDGLGRLVYHDPSRGLVGLPRRVLWSQLFRLANPVWDVTPRALNVNRSDLEAAKRDMRIIMQRLAYDTGLERRGAWWETE